MATRGRPRQPIPHGTTAGYRAHYRRGVPMCEDCRVAERRKRGAQPRRLAPCGTRSAYHRHRRYGESCNACRRANSEQCRLARWERRRRGLPEGDSRHGTINGYGNHGCRCRPCVVANSAKSAERRDRLRSPSSAPRVPPGLHPHGALTGSVIPDGKRP